MNTILDFNSHQDHTQEFIRAKTLSISNFNVDIVTLPQGTFFVVVVIPDPSQLYLCFSNIYFGSTTLSLFLAHLTETNENWNHLDSYPAVIGSEKWLISNG